MPGWEGGAMQIRAFVEADRAALVALAPRLTIGMPAWRDAAGCLAAVHGWVAAAMERDAADGALLVAAGADGQVAGFISIERATHFSGEREACVGELVVDVRYEGRGVGRELVQAAERWAVAEGYRTLTLITGADNGNARRFYDRLGFQEEEVRLTKMLSIADDGLGG